MGRPWLISRVRRWRRWGSAMRRPRSFALPAVRFGGRLCLRRRSRRFGTSPWRFARAPAGGGFAGLVDILVTAVRAVPLAIFTADCLAIVLYDPSARALGVAHVGWRGTVRGATQKAVRAIGEVGGRAGSLRVAIAPSIGPCCYEVDEPVTAEFARAFGERWRSWVTPSRGGRVMLDLWSANEALLAEAGVAPASIENPRLCTACHPDLLYSYRRGNRGRLATLAALP